MWKVLVLACLVALLVAVAKALALFGPGYARTMPLEGGEMPIKGQVLVAWAKFWGRYGLFLGLIAIILFTALSWLASRGEPLRTREPLKPR